MPSVNRVKKNWWPLSIAVSSALAIVFFQNCSRVQLTPPQANLTSVTDNSGQDRDDNPAQFPEEGKPN
jgi:hypothetical protein